MNFSRFILAKFLFCPLWVPLPYHTFYHNILESSTRLTLFNGAFNNACNLRIYPKVDACDWIGPFGTQVIGIHLSPRGNSIREFTVYTRLILNELTL
jgi:hypothetical protein